MADLNHDKKPDIVVAGSHNISILRGNCDGTFQSSVLFNVVSSNSGDAVDSLALADFNKDGQVDAVVSLGNTIQVACGNGSGSFQSPPKVLAIGLDGQGARNAVKAWDASGAIFSSGVVVSVH